MCITGIRGVMRGVKTTFLRVRPNIGYCFSLESTRGTFFARGVKGGPLYVNSRLMIRVDERTMGAGIPAIAKGLDLANECTILARKGAEVNISSGVTGGSERTCGRHLRRCRGSRCNLVVEAGTGSTTFRSILARVRRLGTRCRRLLGCTTSEIYFSYLGSTPPSCVASLGGICVSNVRRVLIGSGRVCRGVYDCFGGRVPRGLRLIRFRSSDNCPLKGVCDARATIRRTLSREI